LPDVYVPCDSCHGKRYNRETLEIHYKGHTIANVLDMTVEYALKLFENVPTTGLHFHDIEQLLDVLHQLVDQGNTVVVIEHNLDVIKTADWIVDLGPEGGAGGG